ncbi:Hepatic triacylglycerol lipase [Halotydeus destructor]|nr:Hepatic triacylglycerol lipase [Halotydeus destructor]
MRRSSRGVITKITVAPHLYVELSPVRSVQEEDDQVPDVEEEYESLYDESWKMMESLNPQRRLRNSGGRPVEKNQFDPEINQKDSVKLREKWLTDHTFTRAAWREHQDSQAPNYKISLNDSVGVANLVHGLPAVNAMVVGREIALVSYLLTHYEKISRDRIHYIGYDLGAQVMHFAGQWFKTLTDRDIEINGGLRGSAKIGRITGLDPLARNFQGYGEPWNPAYLNSNDAEFVDIIHTSVVSYDGTGADILKNRFGMSIASGHVDFYPNGGDKQPSCTTLLSNTFLRTRNDCSHRRALYYFMASLKNDTEIQLHLKSKHADSYDAFKKTSHFLSILDEEESMNYMGIGARHVRGPPLAHSAQFLKFGLDDDQRFIATPSRRFWQKVKTLKLFDNLSPNGSINADGLDFANFPSHELSSIPTEERDPQDLPGCGRFLAPSNSSGRVHFGVQPYVRQFPWNVCIVFSRSYVTKVEVNILCSASLLTDEFVVTAAHCFETYARERTGPLILSSYLEAIHLMFGIDCKRPIVMREVVLVQDVTLFIHPKYRIGQPPYVPHDIALIKLLEPIERELLPIDGIFSSSTKLNTVCFRKAKQYTYTDETEAIYYSGYGKNLDHPEVFSQTLKWTIYKITLTPLPFMIVEHNFYLLNPETKNIRTTCRGDSGGPFVRYVRHEGDKDGVDSRLSPYTAHLLGTLIGGSKARDCGQVDDIAYAAKEAANDARSSPVTYPLAAHNRLLGFISANDEPLAHLPVRPTDIKKLATQFFVHDATTTGNKGKRPSILSYNMIPSFKTLRNDYTRIYFVTHGLRENINDKDYQDLRDLLVQNDGGAAVVMVNWQRGANVNASQAADFGVNVANAESLDNFVYGLPAVNTMVVGREVALIAYLLISYKKISRDRIHLIGYDLGAHVMHFAGQYYKLLADRDIEISGGMRRRARIGRITGLDPSARHFQGYGYSTNRPYLNEDDADFVDIIHTSAVSYKGFGADIAKNRFGLSVASGHVDFYPNGGDKQPSCDRRSDCSHRRSLYYFTASLRDDTTINTKLKSCHAESYKVFTKLRDLSGLSEGSDMVNIMGISARKPETSMKDHNSHFLYFGLDENQKFVETPSRPFWQKIKTLQLVDSFPQRSSLNDDNLDFSNFPSHSLSSIGSENRDPLDLPACGRFLSPVNSSARINFGLQPYVRQFPWTVCIVTVTHDGDGILYYTGSCTGSLITDEFVVTAAHCLTMYSETQTGPLAFSNDHYQLYLMLGTDCKRPIVMREVIIVQDVTVFVHPNYNRDEQAMSAKDIALIKLLDPIEPELLPEGGIFTDKTKLNTVCWRKSSRYSYKDINEVIYFTGYGKNVEEPSLYTNMLQWSLFKITMASKKVSTTFFARNAEAEDVRNTCKADSGGPFVRYLKHDEDQGLQGDPRVSPYAGHLVGTLIGGSKPICGSKGDISYVTKLGDPVFYSWLVDITSRYSRATTGPIKIDGRPSHPVDIEKFLQHF